MIRRTEKESGILPTCYPSKSARYILDGWKTIMGHRSFVEHLPPTRDATCRAHVALYDDDGTFTTHVPVDQDARKEPARSTDQEIGTR